MTVQFAELGYEVKSADYFQCERHEMLPFIPVDCRRVLDVGCAEGAFGESLKRLRGIEVWGVEPFHSAAEKAKSKLDWVVEGVFGPELALPEGTFDCILFNDVLEHLPAPEAALLDPCSPRKELLWLRSPISGVSQRYGNSCFMPAGSTRTPGSWIGRICVSSLNQASWACSSARGLLWRALPALTPILELLSQASAYGPHTSWQTPSLPAGLAI